MNEDILNGAFTFLRNNAEVNSEPTITTEAQTSYE
jgi:hypothetical protein